MLWFSLTSMTQDIDSFCSSINVAQCKVLYLPPAKFLPTFLENWLPLLLQVYKTVGRFLGLKEQQASVVTLKYLVFSAGINS